MGILTQSTVYIYAREWWQRQDTGDDVGQMRQVSSRGEDEGRQKAAAIPRRLKTTITAAKLNNHYRRKLPRLTQLN